MHEHIYSATHTHTHTHTNKIIFIIKKIVFQKKRTKNQQKTVKRQRSQQVLEEIKKNAQCFEDSDTDSEIQKTIQPDYEQEISGDGGTQNEQFLFNSRYEITKFMHVFHLILCLYFKSSHTSPPPS